MVRSTNAVPASSSDPLEGLTWQREGHDRQRGVMRSPPLSAWEPRPIGS